MKYTYGTSMLDGILHENLKTIDKNHSDLYGYINTLREFEDGTKIVDYCHIVKKYASKEINGLCYDWYIIDEHYQQIDVNQKLEKRIDKLMANLDYLSMMSEVEIHTESVDTNE